MSTCPSTKITTHIYSEDQEVSVSVHHDTGDDEDDYDSNDSDDDGNVDNVNDGSGVSVTWEEGDDHSVFVLLLLLMSYPSRHHHTIVVKRERL